MHAWYLMSGRAHLPYLVVSLHTLRRAGYDGTIRVYAWAESFDLVAIIAKDGRLDIEAHYDSPPYRGRNDQFLRKIQIAQQQSTPSLYLDADTLICADPTPILTALGPASFVATQFNDWPTDGGMARSRILDLADVKEIDQRFVLETIQPGHLSLNGGVWAACPDSPVLPLWHAWTWAARGKFIADEKVLHLMQTRFPDEVAIMADCWNVSPKLKQSNLKDEDVCLWHGHGDSFSRPNKSQRGVDLWLPIFREVVEQNIGGINDWGIPLHCDNRFLKELLK